MAYQQHRPLNYGKVEIYQDQSLGIGAYGKVMKAKCGQLPCAAKLLHDTLFQHNDPGEQVLSRKFEEECQFLSRLQHPNIVQYLTTTRDPASGRAVLLMELMDTSLTKHLEDSVTPLPCHIQVDICHDVALALTYLHSNGVMHRDLSSNNVLLIAGRRAKVTDFGMAKIFDDSQFPKTQLTQVPGTQHYMPPEALITPPNYTYKLDCFSYGVLSLQIASGNPPTPGEAMRPVADPHYPTGTVIVPVPERQRRADDIGQVDPHNPLRPIALRCIRDKDNDRPSASELCEWVAGVKKEPAYSESIKAGEGSSPKFYIELQRVNKENAALREDLAAAKKNEQRLLRELNSDKQSAAEANWKLELEVAGSRNEKLVKKLERRNQGLADLHGKLELTEQQLAESKARERNLQESSRELQRRLRAVEQDYRERDEERVHIQQKALGYKEQEVEHMRRKVKELEGIISDFQAMDLNKAQQAALREFEIERRPTVQPTPNPVPPAATQVAPPIAPILPEPLPQQLAPPIPEWREAKPPPEEMTGYNGQVTVHEGTAYFTQNFVVYTYTESRDKWEELPRCNNKNFGVAIINGQLTAIGGQDRIKVHTADVLSLKERGKKWEKLLPAMPTARVHPASVATPTHLVVAGGTFVAQDPNRTAKGYATVEVMSLKAFQWSTVSSLPEVVRYPQMKHTAGHLLLLDSEKNSVYACSLENLVSTQQDAMVWARKAGIPVQQGASLVALEGQVLALGGIDYGQAPLDSVYRYKMAEDTWEPVKALRTPRSWVLSVVCRDNVLVVVGGFQENWDMCNKTEKITMNL